MKFHLVFVLLIVLVSSYVTPVSAQETVDANRKLDELRTELHHAQDRKAELMIRLEQLNFDLRPENIERHFNGFGSTHPEELRQSKELADAFMLGWLDMFVERGAALKK